MQYLFDVWDNIIGKIRAASQTLLIFDFDGTLTPIVDVPEMAKLYEETKRLLKSLARCRNFSVAIISGREINDLQGKVAIPDMIYGGNHGLEIQGPKLSFVHPVREEIRPVIWALGLILKRELRTIPGARVEDKGITLSVHYRLVEDEKVHEVKNIVENTIGVAVMLGKVKTVSGNKVHEIRPAVPWDKGKAIKYIMRHHGKGGRQNGLLPIYLGDDSTDEDAFKVVEKYGGIAVYVGSENNQSAASYYLKSTREVEDFMRESLCLEGTQNDGMGQRMTTTP